MKILHIDRIPENLTDEMLVVLSSIKSLLMLAGYQQNNPETSNFLTLLTICTARLERLIEASDTFVNTTS